MNRTEAKKHMLTYLKERNIQYCNHLGEQGGCIAMVFNGYTTCPDNILECNLTFYDNCMECRVFFDQNATGWIKARAGNLSNFYRMVNEINARVWCFSGDGVGGRLYKSHCLYTPRFYLTEDYDLTATTVIDYEVYQMSPLETEDYCTAFLPEVMSKISLPIWAVLLNESTVEAAVQMVEEEFSNR